MERVQFSVPGELTCFVIMCPRMSWTATQRSPDALRCPRRGRCSVWAPTSFTTDYATNVSGLHRRYG